MPRDLVVVGREAERVQVGAEGAHRILDLVLDEVGRVARDRELLRQVLGEREELALHLERLLPAVRDAREAQDLVRVAATSGASAKLRRNSSSAPEASFMRVSRTTARRRRSSTRSRELGARARDARVDLEQAGPVARALGEPLDAGQELAARRIGGQRLAQRREGAAPDRPASPRR